MKKDLPDDLIAEWVKSGALHDSPFPFVDPHVVRNYVKAMDSGRIYLKRQLEWLKNLTLTLNDTKKLEDQGLDWRIVEICIKKDEVFIVRVRPQSEFKGRVYPKRESMPSSGEWGKFGWTYTQASHTDPDSAKIARTIVAAKRRMWMRVRRGLVKK